MSQIRRHPQCRTHAALVGIFNDAVIQVRPGDPHDAETVEVRLSDVVEDADESGVGPALWVPTYLAVCRWAGVVRWRRHLADEGHTEALPASLGGCVREGRVALGGAVLTVGANPVEVEARLLRGALACPDCDSSLGPWGLGEATV